MLIRFPGIYSTPYMSNELLKDGTSAIVWAKLNQPLVMYVAEELKL